MECHTHNPPDVLIHAGDLTNQGSFKELEKAIAWISNTDFAAKIIVAGNHDLSLDPEYSIKHREGWNVVPTDVEACRKLVSSRTTPGLVYLQHEHAVIHLPEKNVTLRVFGSPYSPDRGKQNWAFQYSDDRAASIWSAVPTDIDVLVTHTPPAGYCDTSAHWIHGGCEALTATLAQVRPILHVCGHCHEGRGAAVLSWSDSSTKDMATDASGWEDPGAANKKMSLLDLAGRSGQLVRPGKQTAVVNASIMAKSFGRGAKAYNKPIVVDLLLPTHDDDEGRTESNSPSTTPPGLKDVANLHSSQTGSPGPEGSAKTTG